jgi:hypothetical protein
MDKIIIPSSITLERGVSTQKYRWKNSNKFSVYTRPNKRAFVRFSCRKFSEELSKLSKDKRQIKIDFQNKGLIRINRSKKDTTIQGYGGTHPYIQFIVNKHLPTDLVKEFEGIRHRKSKTFPIRLEIDLTEWEDFNIKPEDFLIEVERDAKKLLNKALERGFSINEASKGRVYDLNLIKDGKEFVLAISSHTASDDKRNKEKRIQKILMDISKLLTYSHGKKHCIPIIVSQPIKNEKSWSYSTEKYLQFYKEKMGFRFITTYFKNNWEDDVIRELIKIK